MLRAVVLFSRKPNGGFAMDTTQHQQGEDEPRAGDLLVGGPAILKFLVDLGMPEDTDIYYLRRVRSWPIGKTSDGGGGQLIASKRRLTRHAQKITAPQKTDAA